MTFEEFARLSAPRTTPDARVVDTAGPLPRRRSISKPPPSARPLMTPREVAQAFRVDPKTVTRWANEGRLTSVRTLGGHRRFSEAEVRALLTDSAP